MPEILRGVAHVMLFAGNRRVIFREDPAGDRQRRPPHSSTSSSSPAIAASSSARLWLEIDSNSAGQLTRNEIPEILRGVFHVMLFAGNRRVISREALAGDRQQLRVDKEKRVHWGMWCRRNGLGLPYWAFLPFLVLLLTSREVRASCTGYLILLVPSLP